MGLLGDVVGGVLKIGVGVVKFGVETLIDVAGEAQQVRNNSRGMSDRDLLNGVRDKNSSWAEKVGYASAFKDRHRK